MGLNVNIHFCKVQSVVTKKIFAYSTKIRETFDAKEIGEKTYFSYKKILEHIYNMFRNDPNS